MNPLEAIQAIAVDTAELPFAHTGLVEEQVIKHVHGIMVGNYRFILDTSVFCEIFESYQFCKIPRSPDGLVGMTNIRGSAIPIFNMYQLLGINDPALTKRRKRRLLAIDIAKDGFAIQIDLLPIKLRLKPTHKADIPDGIASSLRPFISSAYYTDELWLELDLFRFIDSKMVH